jgi:hypothetical protein
MKVILMFLFATTAFAKDCGNPNMKKKLLNYEAFIKKNPNTKEINAFLKKHGMLTNVFFSEKGPKKYPDHVEGDQLAASKAVFLHKLSENKDLFLERVFEIASETSEKISFRWHLPVNQVPDGIMGKEIIHKTYLHADCFEASKEVLIAVLPDGKFRAIDPVKFPEKKAVKCSILKKLFQDPDTGSCFEFTDMKSQKKRFLVFENPVT